MLTPHDTAGPSWSSFFSIKRDVTSLRRFTLFCVLSSRLCRFISKLHQRDAVVLSCQSSRDEGTRAHCLVRKMRSRAARSIHSLCSGCSLAAGVSRRHRRTLLFHRGKSVAGGGASAAAGSRVVPFLRRRSERAYSSTTPTSASTSPRQLSCVCVRCAKSGTHAATVLAVPRFFPSTLPEAGCRCYAAWRHSPAPAASEEETVVAAATCSASVRGPLQRVSSSSSARNEGVLVFRCHR